MHALRQRGIVDPLLPAPVAADCKIQDQLIRPGERPCRRAARLVVDIIPATAEEFAANVERDKLASESVAPAVSTPAGGSELPIESRPLVVIDPGHGGIDSGAETSDGVKEKDIVLAFSLRLQELLVPYPPDEMTLYPISTLVNNPRNDSPDCTKPA